MNMTDYRQACTQTRSTQGVEISAHSNPSAADKAWHWSKHSQHWIKKDLALWALLDL